MWKIPDIYRPICVGKAGSLHFDASKLGDPPPTSELNSFVPLTTAAATVAVTTQLWSIGRRPVVLWYHMEGLVSSGGGDGYLPSLVFGSI